MHYRSILLSDIHLGTTGCSAGRLLEFLRNNDADTLYLVGDIIDGWRLKRRPYWPQEHNDLVQKILRKVRKGTRVIYVPGNHDELMDQFIGFEFGHVEIHEEFIHLTPQGKRFLVTHGDEFDGITSNWSWLAHLGDSAYECSVWVSRQINRIRSLCGMNHWSLAGYLKQQVKQAVSFIGNYEQALVRECARRHFDGIVCGHIHHAQIKQVGPILYMNDGDWVESCTALVEEFDGTLRLIQQTDEEIILATH